MGAVQSITNYNDQSNHKLNIKKNNPTIDIQFNENFFLIGTKNFIKKKIANPSALEKYFRGENQEPKLQWSSKTGREKQEKFYKTTLQSRKVCKKKDLFSSKDRSQPSKHLAFLSL